MTYYVAPHGSDADSNPGTDPAQPLRSLTTAIDRIAAVHGESVSPAETVEIAAGSYGPAFGERFPILVPANVEIRGADRDTTIMEYDFSGGVDTCIDLHGSLSDITLSPVTEHSCNYSLRVSRDDATVERVALFTARIDPARHVSDIRFAVRLEVGDGFEWAGELCPQVEDCMPSPDAPWRTQISISGGRIRRCNAQRFWIVSPGYTIFEENEVNVLPDQGQTEFYVVRSRDEAPGPVEAIPLIRNNGFARDLVYERHETDWFSFPEIFVCGESEWRMNTIQTCTLIIASSATFDNNPLIAAGQVEFRRSGSFVFSEPWYPVWDIRPEFRENTFRMIPFHMLTYICDWIGEDYGGEWPPSLLWIASDAQPMFENNVFQTMVSNIGIGEQAVPDFGGGGRSEGGNSFERVESSGCAYSYGDVFVDVGEDTHVTLHASANTWWRDRLRIDVRSGSVDAETDPYEYDLVSLGH